MTREQARKSPRLPAPMTSRRGRIIWIPLKQALKILTVRKKSVTISEISFSAPQAQRNGDPLTIILTVIHIITRTTTRTTIRTTTRTTAHTAIRDAK